MYGQGNYAQFRHAPPTQPPPPFQPAPPGPAPPGCPPPVVHHGTPSLPQSHQIPPGPPPLPYQLGPPAPLAPQSGNLPPPAPVNMGQPYRHPLPMPYAPPRLSYPPPPPLSHGPAHVLPSMPHPPRVYTPPPPPPLQGEGLYRTPVPPPPHPGIQHVHIPPPQPPSFISVTPASFLPSGSIPAGDARPPSLPPPPPPPPPSSPPPIPSSPPSMVFPFVDNAVVSSASTFPGVHGRGTPEHVAIDAEVAVALSIDHSHQHGMFPVGEAVSAEKEVPKIGESSQDLALPPPKPIDEVVRNIEVLCQFIAKVGPDFENMVREKEAGNPHFSFLYGGEPGSDAAVGYEYFQWMKKKCCLQMEPSKEPEQNSASLKPSKVGFSSESVNVDNEHAIGSPASSDMDMEDDDGLPECDSGYNKLNKELVGDSMHAVYERHVGEPSHAFHNTKEHPTSKDDKGSSYTEDVSPIRSSPSVSECTEDADMPKSDIQVSEDASLVNISPAAGGGKNTEVPRVFVKDGSPFRLIQGYASDDSEEEDKPDYTDISGPVRASASLATGPPSMRIDNKLELCSSIRSKNDPTVDIGSCQADSKQTSSDIRKGPSVGNVSLEKSASLNVISHSVVEGNLDGKARSFEPSNDHANVDGDDVDQIRKQQPKDTKQGSSKLNLDEFGRLVREGASDSDSDGMRYDERHGKRGQSSSRRGSPQESRHRWRSRSPRQRDNRNRSRSHSPRSKSPKAFRRTNLLTRRDRDRPLECFNFVRGRCFRGASCRFFHPEFSQNRAMRKIYQDPHQDVGNYDVHDHAPCSERGRFTTKFGNEELNNRQQEETMETCSMATKDEIGKKVALGSVMDNAVSRVGEDDMIQEDNNQGQGLSNINNQIKDRQQVEKLLEAPNSSHGVKEETIVESDPPQLANSLMIQSSPTGESKQLNEDVLEQHNRSEGSLPQSSLHPHPNHDATSQISDQYPPQEKLEAANLSGPDGNSQLQLLKVDQHAPSPIPASNISSPLALQQPTKSLLQPVTVYDSQLYQSDMHYPSRQQIASEHHSQNIHTPNAIWSNYAAPPLSHVNELSTRSSISLMKFPRPQFQQNAVPPRNDFALAQPLSEPHLPGDFTHSQAVDSNSQPLYHMESSHQPPLCMTEYKRSFPAGIQHDQPFGGENQFPGPCKPEDPQVFDSQHREYHMHHQSFVFEDVRVPLSGQEPSSLACGSIMHLQSLPLPRESFPSARPLPGDLLQPRLLPRQEYPSVKDLPYSNYQTSFARQHHTSSSFPSTLGSHGLVDPSIQKMPSESNLPPQISGITIPKTSISMHYNPYASTFEQGPSMLKFSFGVAGRENDTDYNIKYDSSFSSVHGSVGGLGSRMTTSPSIFRRSEEHRLPQISGYALETSEVSHDLQKQIVKKPTSGTLYDPLFDSIEPSSDTPKELVHVQKQGRHATDSGLISEFSSLSRPVDVSCSKEQKWGVGAELKPEVDDFGEVATDAEVEVVENESPQLIDGKDGSPDIPAELANIGAGEVEIDQVHSPGKSKKTKDSRSMKLFKIALAEFVKEVLKPSWRQGNMSKEAFKTIVKKTVDKVSGSVPRHQIPKTQAKINHYVESSQRKLTKLVMGYVDKYVKM